MGVSLFERTNRSVSLTPAGEDFLESAREVLRILDEGVDKSRRVSQGIEGHLTLTFINITHYGPLLHALRNFRTAFPAVSFTMNEATTQEQVDALEQGRADLGFMRPPGRTSPGLRFNAILREPVMIALPAEHRLAGCESIPLTALQCDHFVSAPATWARVFMTSLCSFAKRLDSHLTLHSRPGNCRHSLHWLPAASASRCYPPHWRRSHGRT